MRIGGTKLKGAAARLVKGVSLCAALAGVCMGWAPAHAQDTDHSNDHAVRVLDDDSVDLTSADLQLRFQYLHIGPKNRPLQHSTSSDWNMSLYVDNAVVGIASGGLARRFYPTDGAGFSRGVFDPTESGETYDVNQNVYTNRDGSKYYFAVGFGSLGTSGQLERIVYPDGYEVNVDLLSATFCGETWVDDNADGIETANEEREGPCWQEARPQSVTDSFGYRLKISYPTVNILPNKTHYHESQVAGWHYVAGAKALNAAVEYCDPHTDSCVTSGNWQQFTQQQAAEQVGSGTATVETTVLPDGAQYKFALDYLGTDYRKRVLRPTSTSFDDFTFVNGATAKTLTNGGVTRSYQYNPVTVYSAHGWPATETYTVTRTSASGATVGAVTQKFTYELPMLPYPGTTWWTFAVPELVTQTSDGGGGSVNVQYDHRTGRKLETDFPDGRLETYAYDVRGNLTSVTMHAKPGSGLADVVTSAGYDPDCAHQAKCNKPNWTRDANGNQTDYVYNETTGQILTETGPAPSAGAPRPQTRYEYQAFQAYMTGPSGSVVPAGGAVSMPTRVSACRTTSSCAGTADETVTTYAYQPSSGLNNARLLSKTVQAGDVAAPLVETYGYDVYGNLTAVDGPLDGPGDTTYTRYDIMRRVIGLVSPDPDGAGPLPRPARRFTYDLAGNLIKDESGTVADASDAAWAAMTVLTTTDTAFNTRGDKIRETLSAGGSVFKLIQYSYDADGRLECAAVRMNPAVWSLLPASACTLGTQGSFGPDRITRTQYDGANRVAKVQKGYGTADQADDATYGYSLTGKQTSVTDANGNRAEMGWDGLDRQQRWTFPSPTKGAGQANGADYEEYGYDANGNRLSLRKRDGVTLTYQYDGLNRVIQKTVPASATGAAGYSVFYGYDLRGLQTYARFGSAAGAGISNGYDGFGRLVSSTSNMDGTARALSHQLDPHGNVTRLYGDMGYDASFSFDGLDRMTGYQSVFEIRYDAAGRRSVLAMAPGYVTTSSVSYGYDAVGRLASLGNDLAGTSADQSRTFGYNPASQVVSRTNSNDSYASNTAYNVDRGYSVNGLNQYVSAGPSSFAYDGNGNLISDGSSSYVYDAENKLVSRSNGTTLSYDPLGRLWQASGPSGTARFLYDGDRMVQEYDGSGAVRGAYVHGPSADEPLTWYSAAGRRHLHADHQGSITAIADDAGNPVAINAYDEWGIPNAGNIGRFGYTGQMWLPDLGMWYYKARIYSPTLGRFLQTDPVGYKDQINIYEYVGDDPVNGKDPEGTDAIWMRNPDGSTTLVIPVQFVGSGATPDAIAEIVRRDNSLRISDPNLHIQVVATNTPIDGVLNRLDFSPGFDHGLCGKPGECINKLGGNYGHINSEGGEALGAAAHDILHYAKIKDRYKPGTTIPNKGYTTDNIMASRTGTELRPKQIKEAHKSHTTLDCSIYHNQCNKQTVGPQ